MPKFTGDFQTKMRVRIKVGDNIMVSDFFEGSINYEQFNLDDKHADWNIYDNSKKSYAIARHLFYGNLPKEYWEQLD